MSKIKHIIFDLGGVILNIDYQLTIDAFKKLGFIDFEEFYNQKKQTEFFNAFELGVKNSNQFREFIQRHCANKISDAEIDLAWNAMLLELPKYRIEFLEKLNPKYKIFLLSNTNEIHITAFKEIINNSIGYKRFVKAFNGCYYSSEIGIRKPNKNCFDYVLNKNQLIAKETLFIDDSIQHINGAKSIGIQTCFLNPGEEIVKVVPDIIQ